MSDAKEDHERLVVDQFTRQANSFREFAEMPSQPRQLVLTATKVDAGDTVLDVACGPGVTTCDLAEVAGHASVQALDPRVVRRQHDCSSVRELGQQRSAERQ